MTPIFIAARDALGGGRNAGLPSLRAGKVPEAPAASLDPTLLPW